MTEYVLGHTPTELERLVLQGRLYETATRELFERAGLRPGMRVLDVGCGTGDVSMVVASYVGPTGLVVGVDLSPDALKAARIRAARSGVRCADFIQADLATATFDEPFDAIVGRFILMHQPDPGAFLGQLLRHARPGGVVAFLESAMEASVPGIHSHPHSPTYDRVNRLKTAVIKAAGAHNDMGLRLGPTFVQAGLPYPSLRLHAYQDGGPDSVIPRFAAASLKSMQPMLAELGVASLTDEEIDDMEREMVRELDESGGVLTSPLVVGAAAVVD